MISKLRTVAIIFILLGTVGTAFNLLFGQNTISFITTERITGTGLTWQKYDLQSYITNLTTTITDTTELELKLPWREWVDDIAYLGSNIALVIDYIIMVINILLYPLKIGGYLVKFVLALIGFNLYNTESGIYWLGYLAQQLVGLSIPYI